MKTSPAGRALIEEREGRRLTAYRDTRGIWTIGVGHTGRMSPPTVKAGMTISEAECDACLAADLAPVETVISTAVKVPVSQNEFDALASLGFNIGAAGLRTSSVVRKLNAGDIKGAADAFLLWTHPSVLEGRRTAERAQFLAPDTPNLAGVSRSAAVANQRAMHLAVKATAAASEARTTRNGGAAILAAGGAAAAATAQAGQAHVAAWIVAIVVIGAAIDAAVVAWRAAQSKSFAGNAQTQAAAAAALAAAKGAPAAPSATTLVPQPHLSA